MSIDRSNVTVTGRKFYESSPDYVGRSVREIRGSLKKERDPAIEKGVAYILELDGRTLKASEDTVVKGGQILKFELEQITAVQTPKAVKNELSKLVDEVKDMKAPAKPVQLEVNIKAHAEKEKAMPKKPAKRVSKVTRKCVHGTWGGYQWSGHTRNHPECIKAAKATKETNVVKVANVIKLVQVEKAKSEPHAAASGKPNGLVGGLIDVMTRKAKVEIQKAESRLRATQRKLAKAQGVHARMSKALSNVSDTVVAFQKDQQDTAKTIEELKGLINRLN